MKDIESAGPDAASPAGAAAKVLTQQAVVDALGTDVPPREAAERVTFATWAIVTGKSPGGIFNPLPAVDDGTADKIAARLTERCEGTITAEQVKAAATIEELATAVREFMEAGELDGFVRTLRARPEGSDRVPVFVFHPAGGSTVVYEPLLKRLPADTPVYEAATREWAQVVALGGENGFRNAQASLLAPTGTIGFMMDCDTTGIEPDF